MRSLPVRPAPLRVHRQADDRSTAGHPNRGVSRKQESGHQPARDSLTVESVADRADRAGDTGFDEGLGERQGRVLAAGVRVVHQPGGGEGGVARRRVNSACSSTERTSGVVFEVDTRQPRMRRENTSVTKAT